MLQNYYLKEQIKHNNSKSGFRIVELRFVLVCIEDRHRRMLDYFLYHILLSAFLKCVYNTDKTIL